MPTDWSSSRARLDRLDPALLPGRVGDVVLDRADGDGAVARLLDDAIAFAEPVLRADAAADLGEGVGGGGDLVGLFQPALGGQLQPVGDVVLQRAMDLAERHAALRAAAGLGGGVSLVETGINLGKIPAPARSGPLFRHFPADRDEGQHFRRHVRCSPA